MTGSSVRELAARMNNISARLTARRLKDLIKRRGMHDSKVDFATVSSLARTLLDNLKPHVAEARSLIDKAKERKEQGRLDAETGRAEMLPSEVTILLQGMLESMYEKVCESKNTYAMRCIRTSADIFLAHIDDNLLREGRYPKADENLRQKLMEDKISSAREVYKDVVGALDGTNKQLGVEMPRFPSPNNTE